MGVLVAAAVAWWWLGTADRAGSSDGLRRPEAIATSAGPASDSPAVAYALAIRTLAGEVQGSRPVPVLYVLDRTCPDVMSGPPVDTDCDTPVPADLRRDIPAAVGSFSHVEFVDSADAVTGPDLETTKDGVLVMLGQARFAAGSGKIQLAASKGELSGRGMTYELSYRDGRWQIRENEGFEWIS